jgi:LysR family nitrogen assimilation transcriptional regulator
MDFKQLKAFLTVADTGSVTRASELLHVVQPAVSRQLKLLEEDLGCALFERERHGMVLTEQGQELASYARRAFGELEKARLQLAGTQDEVTGLVTIGLLPSTCDVVSSALVAALASRYPGIKLRLTVAYAGTLRPWLVSGQVDVALLYAAEKHPDLVLEPLIEEELWGLGPKGCGMAGAKAVRMADMAGRALVLPSNPHGIRLLVEHACALENLQLNICVETDALPVQRSVVIDGLGYTILPPIAVVSDLAAGRLEGAPLTEPELKRVIALAYAANRSMTKPVRATLAVLREILAAAVASGGWPSGKWLAAAAAKASPP